MASRHRYRQRAKGGTRTTTSKGGFCTPLAPAALAALCLCLPQPAAAASRRSRARHHAPKAATQPAHQHAGSGRAAKVQSRAPSAEDRARAREAAPATATEAAAPAVAPVEPAAASPNAIRPLPPATDGATVPADATGLPPASVAGDEADFPGAEGSAEATGNQAGVAVAPSPLAHQGVLSSNLWGGRGLVHTASAYPLTRGAFTLTVNGHYFRASNLFVTGDRDSQSGQSVHLGFSPVQGLDLALSYAYLNNRYTGTVPRNLMMQGDPTLRVKYGHHVAGPLALGILGAVRLPGVDGGAGRLFRATSFRVAALASVQPIPRIEAIANVGYDYDRSRRVFAGETPDAVQRFVFGVNDGAYAFWGAGVTGRVSLGGRIDLLPFGEMNGKVGFNSRATGKTNPVQASLGLRGYATRSRTVEVMAACDLRVAGAPAPNSPFGGLPRWRAVGQITVHLGEDTAPKGQCATPVAEQAAALTTFRLRGRAVDAATGQPVLGATVHVAGDDSALWLGTDEATGQFVSATKSTGEPNLHLSARAPGYLPAELDVARPLDGSDAEVVVQLQAEPRGRKLALFKGQVRDTDNGEGLAGAEVEVAALKRTLHADSKGHFSALLPPGRYHVVVRAKGYAPQRKAVPLRAGESLVLNLDLEGASAGAGAGAER